MMTDFWFSYNFLKGKNIHTNKSYSENSAICIKEFEAYDGANKRISIKVSDKCQVYPGDKSVIFVDTKDDHGNGYIGQARIFEKDFDNLYLIPNSIYNKLDDKTFLIHLNGWREKRFYEMFIRYACGYIVNKHTKGNGTDYVLSDNENKINKGISKKDFWKMLGVDPLGIG